MRLRIKGIGPSKLVCWIDVALSILLIVVIIWRASIS